MANTTTNVSGLKLSGAPVTMRIPPNYPVEPTPGKLEDLLLYNERAIYHKYKPYTDNTNLLKFGREQPYIYTYIDEKNKPILPPIPRGKSILQNRAIPIEPATTDLVRISYYLTSGRGIEFLTKQLLLQAQQPFDETGVYNPLEVPLAVASTSTLGVIPRPVRHVNISGNVLGALASLIGISVANGNTAPPSSVGQDALPHFGKKDGKGLLRASTAKKAEALVNALWPESKPVKSGFFSTILQSAKAAAVDTAKAFFKPIFPLRQKSTYRGDEDMYDRMYSDVPGRLMDRTKDETPIHAIPRKAIRHLAENRVYDALYLNANRGLDSSNWRYLQSFDGTTLSVVDTSLNIAGAMSRNFRMVRSGAGDGLNQVGVLPKGGPNTKGVPIGSRLTNYVKWDTWNPYSDDVIAFFFYDIVNEKYIPFRATVRGINDNSNAQWEEFRFIGRADQLYTYSGFTRTLAFQFSVVISSLADLLPTWQKLNYLKTAIKPSGYTVSDIAVFNRFMIPPMYTLTVGDMYKYQPIILKSVTISIPDNATWETLNEDNSEQWSYFRDEIVAKSSLNKKTAQLPKEVDVSIACDLLEKERAVVGGVDFGHAPRDNDGKDLEVDVNKPYLPRATEFSRNVRVSSPFSLQQNEVDLEPGGAANSSPVAPPTPDTPVHATPIPASNKPAGPGGPLWESQGRIKFPPFPDTPAMEKLSSTPINVPR